MLDIVANYHCMQFQGKLMNQTWRNRKKTSFESDFDPFSPNSGCQFFCFFFQKSGSVSHQTSWSAIITYNIRKKLMIQSWVNLVTDGRTDGQTYESDFIGRCPTNVERSISRATLGFWTGPRSMRNDEKTLHRLNFAFWGPYKLYVSVGVFLILDVPSTDK